MFEYFIQKSRNSIPKLLDEIPASILFEIYRITILQLPWFS